MPNLVAGSTLTVGVEGEGHKADEMRGIPFWDDLFCVTGAVPPWSIFKMLAENPEIKCNVPVPLTFLIDPGTRVEARLCMGLDHKLLIRRSRVSDEITFEVMGQNLKSIFDARGSDGQPFVCTVYGDDWRPSFVLSENFNLLILHLRHSCGLLSASYGLEEQRQANSLFPQNIHMVQAYLPLETQTRYLAVTLRSPIKSLLEVYRAPHLGRGCFSNPADSLDSIIPQRAYSKNDFYQPLDPDNDTVHHLAIRMSASLIANMRKQCKFRLPGLLCEFVRDIQGDLYLVGALRCTIPQVKVMSETIKPWRPSEKHLMRILGQPSLSPTGHPSLTRQSSLSTPRPKQAPAKVARFRKEHAELTLVVDGEDREESLSTSMQSAGPGKQPGRKPGLNLTINPIDDKSESKHFFSISDMPEGQCRTSPKESQKAADWTSVTPLSKYINRKEEMYGPGKVALSKKHHALIERAEAFIQDRCFQDAIETLADAETAALEAISQRPQQAAHLLAHPLNAECFRCGDKVYANLEKSGYAHFEWRSKVSSAAARESAKRLHEKNKLATSRRTKRVDQLDHALTRMEITEQKGERQTFDVGETQKSLPLTMCRQCLDEAKKDIRNEPYVRGIRNFREKLAISVHAGSKSS